MILQALNKLYYDLLKNDRIFQPGWSKVKVGYALCINTDGSVDHFQPLKHEVIVGDKTKVESYQTMVLPTPTKRSSNPVPFFLCDNSSYILGIDNKGNPARSKLCFSKCARLHNELLSKSKNETAKAILLFFEKWNPDKTEDCDSFRELKEDIINSGANIVFRINGKYANSDPEISTIWQNYYDNAEGELIQCLVSGENDVLETVHPAVKGVADAQPIGATLVSYNAEAFWSYGKEYGDNAPIGKKAAFAYTAALNYLLAEKENVQHIGDTTVVCWAEGAESQYQQLSIAAIFGVKPPNLDEDSIRAIVKKIANGLPCEEQNLYPEKVFYILGLSPNVARLAVRFFYRSSFGELMKNINDHHERLQISGNKFECMPLWALLRETANLNSKDKTPSSVLAGAVARSVFSGLPYPVGLLEATMLRIRAERNITPGRASIIKAYYLKNQNSKCPKEVLRVSLNENSVNIPYTIGRLFAIYEAAQEKANPGINTTIRDKYFNSVAATPAHILPLLNNLYQKHLKKMEVGVQVYYEKQVSELLGIIGESFPTKLSLPEQGAFQLGYYHQKQKRFEKKEK